ncbi:MAG: His/Gly/Thr/Pro-type tRNA ligase C-terminal domain-containing protein, partial [Candidatus Jordarchaeales archaeon]
VDLMRRSYKKQLEYCEKKGINAIVFVGEKEASTGTVTIYFKDGKRRYEQVALNEAIKFLRQETY